MKSKVTEKLADFVSRLKYEDLSESCVEQAKLALLDVIGSQICGARMPCAKTIISSIKRLGEKGKATIIGDGSCISGPHAAATNAVLAEELEYVNHSHTPVVPAALAAGESNELSGEAVIEGIVAGYEILTRIKRSMEPSQHAFSPGMRPWWGGTFGSFGAAAAASKVMGLNKDQVISAFGYLAVSAPVPMRDAPYDGRPQGNVDWGIHAVYFSPVFSGVMAAILAKEGYKGNQSIFDDPNGFWRMAGTDRFEATELTRDLGHRYAITDTFYKRYPHCGQLHSILFALENIIKGENISKERINEILVRVPANVPMPIVPYFAHYDPKSPYDAQFSLPCAVSYLIFEGKPSIRWYLDDTFKNEQVLEFAKKVSLKADKEADDIALKQGNYVNTIRIRCKDNAEIEKKCESGWAFGEGSLKDKESVEKKFRDATTLVLPEDLVEKLAQAVLELDQIKDVSALMNLLRTERL